MEAAKPYVVGVGAANVDISGKSRKGIVNADSNPGQISISSGGVTRNILDNLSRLHVDTKLISAIGTDSFSELIRKDCAEAGIDVSHLLVVDEEPTSSYIDVLDDTGNVFVAVSDMRILERMTRGFLEEKRPVFDKAEAIVVDGCLPPELIVPLVTDICREKPVFIDTVSTAYARTAKMVMGHCHTIKPNLAELEILSEQSIHSHADVERACEKVLESGAKRVVVTLGAEGCYYADAEGERMFRSLRKLDAVENATGAGDAFTAGLLYGFLHKLSIAESLDFALGAGIVAISSIRTINPEMRCALVMNTVRSFAK